MSMLNSHRQTNKKNGKEKKGFKLEPWTSTLGILTEIACAGAIILAGFFICFLLMQGK